MMRQILEMARSRTLPKMAVLAVIGSISLCQFTFAQEEMAEDTTAGSQPAPPTELVAVDRPWDKGEKVDLTWKLSPDPAETIASYRIYRSLTDKPTELDDLELRIDDLRYMFENMELPSEELRAEIEELLPGIRAIAVSRHARKYKYRYFARRAITALEEYLTAGMTNEELKHRAGKAVKIFYKKIKLAEVQSQDEDLESAAERTARMQLTAPILEELFGPGWKEVWYERVDEIPTEVKQRLYELRDVAEDEAEASVRAEAAARRGERRYKMVAEVEAELLDEISRGMSYTIEMLHEGQGYHFKVVAVSHSGVESEAALAPNTVQPRWQFYDGNRLSLMFIVLIICGSVVCFILIARSGRPLNVRKIAGLSAVEEAVGRATEMGRSILFVCGIQDMNDIQTIAGITVLSKVSKMAAEYDARVEVPTARSLVMTAARETVQASYLEAGRPDAYNPDNIYYVTDEQFGFVAYLQGNMVREKPAACFYMGTFFAESLILAETGNSIGAIQIAGTAMPAQLPFFVAACDYTLIGEEFFAASAYLSGEPDQLGSLKGQDVGKVVVAAMVIIGTAFATAQGISVLMNKPVVAAHPEAIVDFIKDVVLT